MTEYSGRRTTSSPIFYLLPQARSELRDVHGAYVALAMFAK